MLFWPPLLIRVQGPFAFILSTIHFSWTRGWFVQWDNNGLFICPGTNLRPCWSAHTPPVFGGEDRLAGVLLIGPGLIRLMPVERVFFFFSQFVCHAHAIIGGLMLLSPWGCRRDADIPIPWEPQSMPDR